MTRIFELVQNPVRQLVTIQCNKCKKVIQRDGDNDNDLFEFESALLISFTGGYGSVWGDGEHIKIDLCQHCAFELLSPYADDMTDPVNGDCYDY